MNKTRQLNPAKAHSNKAQPALRKSDLFKGSELGPMQHAALANRADALLEMIHEGLDPNNRNAFGQTPLMLAAAGGSCEAIEELLRNGADPAIMDRQGCDPLCIAIECGQFEAALALAAKPGNPNARGSGLLPVQLAIQKGLHELALEIAIHQNFDAQFCAPHTLCPILMAIHADMREAALAMVKFQPRTLWDALDPHGMTPLMRACQKGMSELALELATPASCSQASPAGDTPIALAIKSGNPELAAALAEKCPQQPSRPNKDGWDALALAIKAGHAEAALAIAASGAAELGRQYSGGQNIIHLACAHAPETLPSLLRLFAGSPLLEHLDDSGRSPAGTAAAVGSTSALAALMRAGAAIGDPDLNGRSPLHHAAFSGHAHCVSWLIRQGLDPAAKDLDGCTPLALAARHPEVAQLLRETRKAKPIRQDPTTQTFAHPDRGPRR